MREITETPATRAWTAAYWLLTVVFIVTAALSVLRIPAGFISNYGADLACPAWLYIVIRGLHGPLRPSPLRRYVGGTPEWAALVLFGGSTLTELSQLWWPDGIFAGTYDPYDIVAYAVGVGTCYAFEKRALSRARKTGRR